MSFLRINHDLAKPNACPVGGYQFSDEYAVTVDNWFHTLPTGIKNMVLPNIVGDLKLPGNHPLGDPQINYEINSVKPIDDFSGCVGSSYGLVAADIEFENIPAYACITDWLRRTPISISTMLSQLACFGVWWNSSRLSTRRASGAGKAS
jgi:hypothetical protein